MVLCLAGCGGASLVPTDSEQPGNEMPSTTPGKLVLTASGQGLVQGTYESGNDRVTFRSAFVDGDIDLQVTLNGLVLDALMRPADGVSSMDGFAAASGADTQLVD